MEYANRTLGQAALQWLLYDPRVAYTLPNIYNEQQLIEFAAAPDTRLLTDDELGRIRRWLRSIFGSQEEVPKFKGTMAVASYRNDYANCCYTSLGLGALQPQITP